MVGMEAHVTPLSKRKSNSSTGPYFPRLVMNYDLQWHFDLKYEYGIVRNILYVS